MPASSLILPYFSVSESQHMSYKTLQVYLCGIHLWHIEERFEDLTSDPLLATCKVTYAVPAFPSQSIFSAHLQQSPYFLAEQRILWLAFILAFYGFLYYSEYLNLQWLDISYNNRIIINLRQSENRSLLKKPKSMHIQSTHPHAQYKLFCCACLSPTGPLQVIQFSWKAALLP